MNHAHRSPAYRYGGKCSEAMLALRALHVEKGLRLGEVRRAIEAIADDVERAAASERARAAAVALRREGLSCGERDPPAVRPRTAARAAESDYEPSHPLFSAPTPPAPAACASS